MTPNPAVEPAIFDDGLPGADLVRQGLVDLARDKPSREAMLVCIGAPRLRNLGITVPQLALTHETPERALYQLLATENPATAHSTYNGLLRRLISFEQGMERQRSAKHTKDKVISAPKY